jgi:hypothetical protein
MSTPNRIEINRPQPEAGPQPSILGAMQYTLDAEQVVVMPKEDRELYHIHLQTFRDQHQPQGAIEEHLVQSLADLSWRLNRVVALETNILSIAYAPRDLVDGLLGQAKALASLSLHSRRLSRQFERTIAQLRELQKTRLAQEERQLDDLVDIMEMYESRGETYNRSADGFVFTDRQITGTIHARNRRLAREAYRAAA